MHLDEEQVQRLMHRELGDAEMSIRRHLDACSQCRDKVTEAEQVETWVLERLRKLDHSLPPTKVETLARPSRRRPRYRRVAAVALLALSASGVAYALPGSPLPGVVHRLAQLVAGGPRHQPGDRRGRPEGGVQGGIAVNPGKRLTILFPIALNGEAIISLTDGDDVLVRALTGAAFTSDLDQLSVEHRTAAPRYEIRIPRTAPWVQIQVGGHRLLLQRLGRVTAVVRSDAEGNYRLPLSLPLP
jgi:hypothetical protein